MSAELPQLLIEYCLTHCSSQRATVWIVATSQSHTGVNLTVPLYDPTQALIPKCHQIQLYTVMTFAVFNLAPPLDNMTKSHCVPLS